MQSHSSFSLTHFISGYTRIGFSGSRHSSGAVYNYAAQFLPSISNFQGNIGVGCAKGIDSLVRNQFPQTTVFKVQPPINRKAFAIRSTKLVHWLATSNSILIAFPSTPCPKLVVPSNTFHGYGSGTWGTIALALGIGIPVLISIHTTLSHNLPAPKPLSHHFKPLQKTHTNTWYISQ